MSKPVCVHCGKGYGQRLTNYETVRWDAPFKLIDGGRAGKLAVLDGEAPPPPPYKGNGVVVKERHAYMSADDHRMVMEREVWDGESWRGGYDPFCTLRCALDYARKAYKKEQRK